MRTGPNTQLNCVRGNPPGPNPRGTSATHFYQNLPKHFRHPYTYNIIAYVRIIPAKHSPK